MERDGTLAKLIEIFRNDKYQDKDINTQSACSIGYLFKAIPIPSDIRSLIIIHLKHIIIIDTDSIQTSNSLVALCCLAECEQNHEIILRGEFLIKLNELINEEQKKEYYFEILSLFIKLFNYGNNETKQNIINIININYIEQLTHHLNKSISNQAREFIIQINLDSIEQDEKEKWIQNEIKLKEIILQCEDKSSEEKMKIIEQGCLKQICQIINIEQDEIVSQLQQQFILLGCEAALILINDNPSSFPFALEQGGIVDVIITILCILPIKNIHYSHIIPIVHISINSKIEQNKIIKQKGILKVTKKLLSSQHENILIGILFILFNITNEVCRLENEGNSNSLLKQMEDDGTLKQLVEVFQNQKLQNKKIKNYSSFVIGNLYKASQIPSEFGSAVINHLQNITYGQNNIDSNNQLISLIDLALCKNNQKCIVTKEFIHQLNTILTDDNNEQFKYIFNLLITLVTQGSTESLKLIQQELNINLINKIAYSKLEEKSSFGIQFMKYFEMLRMTDLQIEKTSKDKEKLINIFQQGEGKRPEERTKIIEQGGLKDICKIIHSSLEGEMNWNKQYLTRIGCEAASALLEENKESFLFAIEIGGIIDEVISLLNKLSIENINYQHLLPLFRITNFSNFEQRKILVEKGILKGLSKTFSSENDVVVSFSVFIASRILNGIGQLEGEGKLNPLLQELESDGTLTKLVEIFLTDNFNDIFLKVYSACSIGRIFKATQLPVEFGFQVIEYLKDISIGSKIDLAYQSIITLTCLAECECTKNHSLILSEEFLHKMSYILIEEKENLYKPFLELVLKLFKYGIDETKLNLKKVLNIDQINKLTSNDIKEISNKADELLKLIEEFIKK